MTKYALIVIFGLLILLSGCSLDYYDYDISSVPYFDTWEEYHDWYRTTIVYKETGAGMYNPNVVLECGYGECDSNALCLGYIIETRLGIPCEMIVIQYPGFGWHACLGIDGRVIDPLNKRSYYPTHNHEILYTRTVDDWLKIAKD